MGKLLIEMKRKLKRFRFIIRNGISGNTLEIHTPPPVTGLLVGPLLAISLSSMSRTSSVGKVILGISSS